MTKPASHDSLSHPLLGHRGRRLFWFNMVCPGYFASSFGGCATVNCAWCARLQVGFCAKILMRGASSRVSRMSWIKFHPTHSVIDRQPRLDLVPIEEFRFNPESREDIRRGTLHIPIEVGHLELFTLVIVIQWNRLPIRVVRGPCSWTRRSAEFGGYC